MSTAQRTLRGAPEHILAARAAYSLPYGTLTRYTRDPFGDLAAGRHDGAARGARRRRRRQARIPNSSRASSGVAGRRSSSRAIRTVRSTSCALFSTGSPRR